jgi:hypothetical protein
LNSKKQRFDRLKTGAGENMEIKWRAIAGKQCLYFKFQGQFTEADAKSALGEWKAALAAQQAEKIVLVWDCLQMNGYELGARKIWQTALSELKGQVDTIWVISGSMIINIGARVMATFTKLNLKVVSNESEISFDAAN